MRERGQNLIFATIHQSHIVRILNFETVSRIKSIAQFAENKLKQKVNIHTQLFVLETKRIR